MIRQNQPASEFYKIYFFVFLPRIPVKYFDCISINKCADDAFLGE